MTEVTLVKRTITLAAIILLVLGAAACTREKPPTNEPTPTLIAQQATPPPLSSLAAPTVSTTTEIIVLPTESAVTPMPTFVPLPTAISTPAPSLSVATPAPSNTGGSTTYTVQWGDWLSKIAQKFGVTTQAILAANPSMDANRIYPGQVINIPASGTASTSTGTGATTATGGATTYTVQRGDWFYSIARKFGVSVQALMEANPGVNPNVVYPGQVLNIPGGSQPAQPASGGTTATGTSYTVQQGDTLYSIAVRFGKTAYELQMANHLASANSIYPGQTLIIP